MHELTNSIDIAKTIFGSAQFAQFGIIRVIRVMRVVVLTDESLKAELLANADDLHQQVIWVDTLGQLQQHADANAWIDLLFEKEHLTVLQNFLPKTIIINSVVDTLNETDSSFVRINAWPTLLKSDSIEASCLVREKKQVAETIFSLFNKKMQWLPDEPGFVTPRVVSMIINEAFISLQEGVSTREEIDLAMKLGTNYPNGPFEWADKIGMNKVKSLLEKLSISQDRYTPFVS